MTETVGKELLEAQPIHGGQYHVRILRTASTIGDGNLQLYVPSHVRHDTGNAVIVKVPADNPLNLIEGDVVVLNMKQGGYGFDMKDGSQADSKYLIHPGNLMFKTPSGHNHFMVDKEDILMRLKRKGESE